jgi:Fe2+ or Zn2+ uptake regulation protein
MRTVAELVDAIHARGGKMTPQRLVIYQALEKNVSHPTADAVYGQVRIIMPTISLTTIYKTLNELVAFGELKRVEVAGITHFDPDTSPHGEAVCLRCGRIVDVHHAISDIVDAGEGFYATSVALTFYGYCRECGPRIDATLLEGEAAV